jgi:solute carrier family 35 protein E1
MAGVILTCFSSKRGKNIESGFGFYKGLIYAFVSMVIFVSQNIFAKKILTIKDSKKLPLNIKEENEEDKKIDKITILLYCSLFGFALTLPIYAISELSNDTFTLFEVDLEILSLFFIHGLSHFCQAMIAFHLIGTISPVNYSIANILKRIVVIAIAILCEHENVTSNQGFGLVLTIFGLYAYDKWGITQK